MMCSRKRVNHAFIPTDGFLSFNRLNVVGIQKGFFMNKVANPVTPIPPRASAHSSNSVKVRPRYSRTRAIPGDNDVTCIPTMPQPAIWQYESPEYEAGSSLSALSLVLSDAEARSAALAIDEIDTLPPPRRAQPLFHAKLSISIDEIETLPPPQRRQHLSPAQKSLSIAHRNVKRQSRPRQTTLTLSGIDELDTLPPGGAASVMTPRVNNRRNMLSDLPTAPIVVESNPPGGLEASSWTAGRGKNSALAQRVASRTRGGRSKRKNTPALNPIDRLRWWLLYPGRIEFLLWLSGILVLVSATCLLLFAIALSTGWMSVGLVGIPKGTFGTVGRVVCLALSI